MIFSNNNFLQILLFLIQYTDDIDVGQFLLNCDSRIIKRKPKSIVDDDNILSNKELLLQKLLVANYKFYNSYTCVTSDNIKQDRQLTDIIIEHLKAINRCYISYFLYDSDNEIDLSNVELAISKDKLGIGTDKTISIEDYKNCGNIPKEDIKKILSIIINNYKQYGYYYAIEGDSVCKINIQHSKKTETHYHITYAERTTYLTNEQTGLKINIKKPIKFFGLNKEGVPDVLAKGLKDFKKLTKAIIEALAKEPAPCCYCYPDKKEQPKRKRCLNCDEIIQGLHHLQGSKTQKIKTNKKEMRKKSNIINVEQGLKSINYGKYNNIMTLRKARKQFLEKVLDNCKQTNPQNDELIKHIKSLIDKGFGAI